MILAGHTSVVEEKRQVVGFQTREILKDGGDEMIYIVETAIHVPELM